MLTMTQRKRSHQGSMNSADHNSRDSYCKPCLITAENYLDLKTNSRFLNKKQDRGVYQFLKFFQVKRRSYLRRPKKWLISIVGLSSLITPSETRVWVILIHIWSLNQESWLTRKQMVYSTKP